MLEILGMYLIAAISFAISSLFFIHKSALRDVGVINYPLRYDIAFVLVCTISFPYFLFVYLTNPTFNIIYGVEMGKVIKKLDE
jgi:hypothetical protein